MEPAVDEAAAPPFHPVHQKLNLFHIRRAKRMRKFKASGFWWVESSGRKIRKLNSFLVLVGSGRGRGARRAGSAKKVPTYISPSRWDDELLDRPLPARAKKKANMRWKISPQANYLLELERVASELDLLAQEYLSKLPTLEDDEIAKRLWDLAHGYQEPIDWDNVPDWAATILDGDGYIPYYGPPQPGSLGHSLGMSLLSRQAHLRNLLERAEGRETKELEFPVCACNKCNPEGHA